MNYQQTQRYLDSFINYEKLSSYPYKESFKLERMYSFLETIGQPQRQLKVIHIAGTKGKGSTCAFIAYILRRAGFRVGLYTSPHLITLRERIRILEPGGKKEDVFSGMIDEEETVILVNKLKPAIENFAQRSIYGPLSFFEVYTALAFLHFKEKNPDFCVLETGLGGRLDATNTCQPICCAIAPISFEHTQKLGNTLTEIATEKCGIIKKGVPVVSAPQEEEAERVIREKCRVNNSALISVGRDIVFENIRGDSRGEKFDVRTIHGEYKDIKITLRGAHQVANACVALGIAQTLKTHNNIGISEPDIREGLAQALWPGRLETVSRQPLIILDGAQNAASARALAQAIKNRFKYKKAVIILGISKDKDIPAVTEELEKVADEFILTKADNPRGQEPGLIKKKLRNKNAATLTRNVAEAIFLLKQKLGRQDIGIITGSLFVVGQARHILKPYADN